MIMFFFFINGDASLLAALPCWPHLPADFAKHLDYYCVTILTRSSFYRSKHNKAKIK